MCLQESFVTFRVRRHAGILLSRSLRVTNNDNVLGVKDSRLKEPSKNNAGQQLHREIRTTSYLLHPPLLDESGLASALNMYVDGLAERSDVAITLDVADNVGRLPSDMELTIFQLVQECLTNIHRHSGSKTAPIRARRRKCPHGGAGSGKGHIARPLDGNPVPRLRGWNQRNSRAYTSIPRRNENRIEWFRYLCDCQHPDAQGSPFTMY
jgi:hypothetical protein